MALIQLLLEKQVLAKHVESVLLPRLDPGSTPGISTFHKRNKTQSPANLELTGLCVFLLKKASPETATATVEHSV